MVEGGWWLVVEEAAVVVVVQVVVARVARETGRLPEEREAHTGG